MRFLLVMLAVAAPMTLPACENTKAGERDASASGNTKDVAPVALQAGAVRPDPPGHELRSEALRPAASAAISTPGTEPRAPGTESPAIPSEAAGTPSSGKNTANSGLARSGTANDGAGNPPPTAADEAVDEGNGEPMDDVDDEEASVTDKSGVDSPAVDEEPEGTGIKLQE